MSRKSVLQRSELARRGEGRLIVLAAAVTHEPMNNLLTFGAATGTPVPR